MELIYWLASIFAIIAILIVISYTIGFQGLLPVIIVDSQQALVIDNRFGKDRVITEGLNKYIPGVEVIVGEPISLKEQPIDPPAQEIISKDNINLSVDMIATIRVVDPLKAVMDIENFKEAVESLVVGSTLNKLGQMNFSDIQKQQDIVSSDIKSHMKEDCDRWGVEVVQIRFESISPPPAIKASMEKEIVAKQEKEAAILRAEGEHQVHEMHADSEKILIEKRAEATHKVIKDLKELMPNLSDESIMQFLTKTAYIDSMKELSSSSNSKVVLYPADVHQPMEKLMSAEYMTRTQTDQ